MDGFPDVSILECTLEAQSRSTRKVAVANPVGFHDISHGMLHNSLVSHRCYNEKGALHALLSRAEAWVM